MKWSIKKVRRTINGRLVGNLYMRKIVCKTLLFLPSEIIDYVCTRVWFMSSPEDSWAFTFRGSDIKNRSLIFISDELLKQNEEQIRYTILHEIGHVILNHRNSIGYKQSETEIKQQEIEADQFAKKYLNIIE